MKPKTERNRQITEMRAAGATYRKIGQTFGICGETVRQILRREERLERRKQMNEESAGGDD